MPWTQIAVVDILEIAGDSSVFSRTVELMKKIEVNSITVLSLVTISHYVALVVISLTQKPTENMSRESRIIDPRVIIIAIYWSDIGGRDRAPMGLSRINLGPHFNAREEPFYTWSELGNVIGIFALLLLTGWGANPLSILTYQDRYEIIGVRYQKDIRVAISRQPFIGLASDVRNSKLPSKAKWAITRARVVW
jgi:hypothetical protein